MRRNLRSTCLAVLPLAWIAVVVGGCAEDAELPAPEETSPSLEVRPAAPALLAKPARQLLDEHLPIEIPPDGVVYTHDVGSSCTDDGDCHMGVCRDGFCCATDCNGGVTTDCQSCANAQTGLANGVCGPITLAANHTCRASAGACDVGEVCPGGATTACPADVFLPSSTVCRAAVAGGCDVAENCTGSSAACPADAVEPSTTVCRPSAGTCDVAENCTGSSNTCPANGFAASSTVCRPAVAGGCDIAENCTGSSATCPADVVEPSSTVCRASAGTCDVAENCTGSSNACPADGFAASSTVCRTSAGPCDLAENCTGSSASCPADAFRASSFVCRSAVSTCDVAENCSGSSASCPADAVAPSTTVCRASADVCDVAENCDGTTTTCPANGFQPSTTVCRASAGACDVAENCTGTSATCPTDAFLASTTVCRAAVAGGCDVAENCTGTSATCPTDAFQPSTTVCRASVAACDVAENCTGTSNACPADAVRPSTFVCRAAVAGGCDVAENCDGSSTTCPADVVQPNGTICRATAGTCDVAENCNGTANTCPADAFQASTVVCRVSAGTCDVAENCTGTSAACPGNSFLPSTTVCRAAAAGGCDVAENCTGTSASCPTDAFLPSSTVCRASAGTCDVAENCPGTSATCPADALRPSSFTCRATAGSCDVAENCTGTGVNCPTDAFLPSTTVCRAAVAGGCDIAENCTGTAASCPADAVAASGTLCRGAATVCDVAENCNGVANTCPTDAFAPASTVCRTSAGPCDLAENCTGTSSACPSDAFRPSSFTCRAVADVCDVAENCTGSGAACPADAFRPSSFTCRASAGVCDVAENCTGSGAACPADAFQASTTICRAVAAGGCDVAENCTGSAAACPTDGFQASTFVCRAAADQCDAAELCPGTSATCPSDVDVPNGTSCDDANVCTASDNCQTGTCVGGEPSIRIEPDPVVFATTRVGEAATDVDVTISNVGNGAITLTGVSTSSSVFPIRAAPTFSLTLSPLDSEIVTVGFEPALSTSYVETFSVMSSTCAAGETAGLQGVGQLAGIQVMPPSHDFGDVRVDLAPASQTFTVRNVEDANFQIDSISITDSVNYTLDLGTLTFPRTMAPDQQIQFDVLAHPSMVGAIPDAEVLIDTDIPTTTPIVHVPIDSTGIAPGIDVDPTTHDFGNVDVQGAAPTRAITITNDGSAPLLITDIVIDPPGTPFSISSAPALPATLSAPGDDVTFEVTYAPSLAGTQQTATAIVQSNGYLESQINVGLMGTPIDRMIVITPTSVEFGSVLRNTPSSTISVEISNPGLAPLALGSPPAIPAFEITGVDAGNFQLVAEPSSPIVNGAPQSVDIVFTPTAEREFDATLVVNNDDSGNPMAAIALHGTGFIPDFMVSTVPLSAGTVPVGVTRDVPGALVVTNADASQFQITRICIGEQGTGACEDESVFDIVDGLGAIPIPFAAGEQREVRFTFSPTEATAYNKEVLLFIETDTVPMAVSITGIGIDDVILEGGGCGCRVVDRDGRGAAWAFALAVAIAGACALGRRRGRRRAVVAAIAVALALATVGTAWGEKDTAFDLGVFRPAAAGASGFITVERPSVPRAGDVGISLFVDYAQNPLVSRRQTVAMGSDAPVSDRTALSLVGSYGLAGRAEVGVVVPVLQQQGTVTMTGVGVADGTALGDVGVWGKVKLFGDKRLSAALAATITLPTGDDSQYAGAAGFTGHGRAILGVDLGSIRLAGNLGLRFRAAEARLGGVKQKHELTFGVGTGVRLAGGIDAIGELYGNAALGSSEGSVSPLEVIGGVRWWAARSFAVTAGAGGGLMGGIGASDVRVFVGLSFSPRGDVAQPLFASRGGGPRRIVQTGGLDSDEDGIDDVVDKCPDEAEDLDGFEDEDGCREDDNDRDLIVDGVDKCPNEAEDRDGVADDDGCPDGDDDGDGVPDADDKCPKEQEDVDGFQDNDGCDDPDNDKDGIPDVVDACALEAETINGNNDDDGCPDQGDSLVLVSQGRIEILEAIAFNADAGLKPSSRNVLKQVAATLRASPQILKLRINSHVDSRGDESRDYKLSQRRGEAVRKFLTESGVEPERLEVKPYGSQRPLDPKGSRDINDRIEFVIMEETNPKMLED